MTSWIRPHFRRFGCAATALCDDQAGATMLEYCLIGALLAAVCVTALTTLGGNLDAIFNSVVSSIAPHH